VDKKQLDKILQDHKLGKKANLSYACLIDADLSGISLKHANLSYASLRGTDLSFCDFSYANMTNVNMIDVNLTGAKLIRTNLIQADIKHANLIEANLNGCIGNGIEIKSISIFEEYPITYTKDVLQIGCENHPIEAWWSFSNERIFEMDGIKALHFWRKNKQLIKQIIEHSPAI
jgi:uncharacterized protein YjbI with pentapeptide repeats